MSARRMHRAQPREKIDPASLKRLAKDTKKYWPLFIIAALCLLVATVFEVLSPNKLGELSNYLMMSALTPALIDMDKVLNYVLVLGIYYCVFALLTYVSGFLIATGVQHYGNALTVFADGKCTYTDNAHQKIFVKNFAVNNAVNRIAHYLKAHNKIRNGITHKIRLIRQ